MKALKRLLVASDFSEPAEAALQRAARIAREHGAGLEVLHVLEDRILEELPSSPETTDLLRQMRQEAEEALQRHAGAILGTGIDFRCRVESGRDFVAIIRRARQLGADLVVLAARGAHSVREYLLGTTPEKVVRKGGGAVLTVRRPPAGPYASVLVPTDFSPASLRALLAARQLCPEALFHLLHVYELWGGGRLTLAGGDREALSLYHDQVRGEIDGRFRAFLEGLDPDPGRIKRHIRHGHVQQVVVTLAEELGADLVATGTAGRSGLPYILLGSVAEHVLREAPCDVLTVRPPDFHFELP